MNRNKSTCMNRICLQHLTPFQRLVLREVMKIPYGKTITYSQLARQIGHPGAVRAVGNALAKNPAPVIIPCHRVVAKNGLGGFSYGVDVKKQLLELESNQIVTDSSASARHQPL